MIIGLIILGAGIGFLSGLLGIGGGFLATPLLNIIFGLPYPIAVGSSLAQMVGTATAGTYQHTRLKQVDYKLGLVMLIFVLIGVESGKNVLVWLEGLGSIIRAGTEVPIISLVINSLFIILLLGLGIFILRDSLKKLHLHKEEKSKFSRQLQAIKFGPAISLKQSNIDAVPVIVLAGMGFFMGLMMGLLGIGGGFVAVPLLIYLVGVPTNMAIGTSLFIIMFASLFGAVRHYQIGNVSFPVVFSILAGSIIGAQLGAKMTKRVPAAHLRLYFSFILLGAAILVIRELARLLLS